MPFTSKTPPHPPDKQARIDAARQHYRTRALRRMGRQAWDPNLKTWLKWDPYLGAWYVPAERVSAR